MSEMCNCSKTGRLQTSDVLWESRLTCERRRNILPQYDQCKLFKQIRPGKSVSLSSARQLKAGLQFLWGTGGGERRWRGESSREMETMLWRGDKWSQSVLATPGEDSHLRAHAGKKLILLPPLLKSENFVSHLYVSLSLSPSCHASFKPHLLSLSILAFCISLTKQCNINQAYECGWLSCSLPFQDIPGSYYVWKLSSLGFHTALSEF